MDLENITFKGAQINVVQICVMVRTGVTVAQLSKFIKMKNKIEVLYLRKNWHKEVLTLWCLCYKDSRLKYILRQTTNELIKA